MTDPFDVTRTAAPVVLRLARAPCAGRLWNGGIRGTDRRWHEAGLPPPPLSQRWPAGLRSGWLERIAPDECRVFTTKESDRGALGGVSDLR
jgi:hypothetical protein